MVALNIWGHSHATATKRWMKCGVSWACRVCGDGGGLGGCFVRRNFFRLEMKVEFDLGPLVFGG